MTAGMIEGYPSSGDRYDEMLAAGGSVRGHWQGLVRHLSDLDADTMGQRARSMADAIEADGVTYTVYDDPNGTGRLWGLDPIPLLINAEEWRSLSAAVAQRARLLDAVLADLYGPQQLLREGYLPPALVYGQKGFQWPCKGVVPPGGRHLHLYAVDLARSPDGNWWVIADRTQGPSGAGYALQNRIVVSQTFPQAFQSLPTQRLADFFRTLQDSLSRMAPSGAESPLCVLLTPGRYNETYFEHVFLARYLGFPLVEGQDLTVRDDIVYLKTLRGLRRVHVILRRLDDEFCDPLELRSDSVLGIPGLLSAVRGGHVLVANALGSGVLESAAIFGFLPAISERLLGEPLAMPSVASWWCGEAPARKYVLEHLDDLVIKPAFASMRMEALFGHQVKGAERDRLIRAIEAQPHAYVAQEWVHLSQAPVWHHDSAKLVPRSVGLRLFAAATPEGYVVMPGALTRVAAHGGVEVISMQRGGLSKDTWVQAEGSFTRLSLLKPKLGVTDLLPGEVDTPSRVGENLFWMGRHSERSEMSARVLRAALLRLAGSDENSDDNLAGLVQAAKRIGALPAEPADDEAPLPLENQLLQAVTRFDQPGSVAWNLRMLGFNADHLRDRLSTDNWHLLNRMEGPLLPPPRTLDQTVARLNQIILNCISLAGFALDDMTRDAGWGFLILGRRIERLGALAAMMSVVIQAPADQRENMLEWLLECANSIVTYRARYRRAPELLPVVHMLVLDETNPHSITFQVQAVEKYLLDVTQAAGHLIPPELGDLGRRLAQLDLRTFDQKEPALACQNLLSLLNQAEQTAYNLSDEIHRNFFIHTVQRAQRWSAA